MDVKTTLALFDSLLESTGGKRNIQRAITTKDWALIVRAATEFLRKTFAIPILLTELKSAEKSNEFRKEGNLYYISKEYKIAIMHYNKALAYAPNNSIEVKLAYGNISAVLLEIKAYRECSVVIKAALALDCPEFLRVKLKKRKTEADKYVIVEMIRDKLDGLNIQNYSMLDNVPKNPDIPCASTDVGVDDGKKLVAAKNIKTGTMVALERAFVSVQGENTEYTSCYYCHKMCFYLIPCEGCCKALFCSDECKKNCLEEYHRVECYFVAYYEYMGSMYRSNRCVNKLTVRAAIKMSLKLGWEELGVASLKIGEKRLKESSVSEAFDCNNPVSILCYNDQNVAVSADNMIYTSLVCAAAVHCLGRVAGYMPEETKKREKAIDTLSRVLLNLHTTFLRKIISDCSAWNYYDDTYTMAAQKNIGWFSFASKMAHSCEPNLLVVGLNDHVGLVALRPIKKGELLTISFIDHFYDITILSKNDHFRQKGLFQEIQYKCNCRVCLNDWDNNSHQPIKLTGEQPEAFFRAKTAMLRLRRGDFNHQLKAVGEALDELAECVNSTQHFELYTDLKKTLSRWQLAKNGNKTYGHVNHFVLYKRA